MKYTAIYSSLKNRTLLGKQFEAKNAKQVADKLLQMGVVGLTIIDNDSIDKNIEILDSLPPNNSPSIIATSKLANVEIAAEDYNIGGKEIDGKHYFTHDEALEVQEKLKDTGWRLPTCSEWVLICEEFGQKDGQLDTETLYKNLNMDCTGLYHYSDGKVYDRTTNGNWWSATRSSATYANYLNTTTSYVYPQYSNYRGFGFALRLVRDIDWGKREVA